MEELSINLTKEERRAQRQKLREAEDQKLRLKELVKKTIYVLVAILVVFGIVQWIINQFPKGQDYSVAFPVLGRDHISDGAPRPDYNSNPPTSGSHYASPANVRFYFEELPDEQLVHNLEHGHVWISYKSNLPTEIIKVLKGFAGRNTIVTPRPANDFDIALASWGRLDKFNIDGDSIDKQRIKNFILRYQNQGPEKVNLPQHIR